MQPTPSLFDGITPRPMIVRHACAACLDSGLVPISAQAERYEDLFTTNIPCVCVTADQWRVEFQLRENPPVCKCGARATDCLLTDRPTCRRCFQAAWNPERDKRAIARSARR